jgi:Homeodomain-like domain
MDVVALRRQGWTITDIAAAVGRHPDTVAKWRKAGGPPARRRIADTVIEERWARRIEELLARNRNLPARCTGCWWPRASLAATRRWCGTCGACAGHGGDGRRRRRCPSRHPGRGGPGRLVGLLRLG